MKRLGLLICAVMIAGCAPSWNLAKPGMTREQWDRDYYECNLAADEAIGFDAGYRTALGNVAASGVEHRRRFESCCEAKGYRKVNIEEYNRMSAGPE